MLHRDDWLSGYFSKGAYRYAPPFHPTDFPEGFICSKVPASNIDQVNQLLDTGFTLVEVLSQFNQKKKILLEDDVLEGCDFATEKDRDQVVEIARNAFTSSRFYHDPYIDHDTASRIKADWVGNYFQGNRGNSMIVARRDDQVLGFILLIDQIIDLIAVAPTQKRQGIGKKMIAFANSKVGLLKAGTQLTNTASIALYQKTGFQLEDSHFVLHRHSG